MGYIFIIGLALLTLGLFLLKTRIAFIKKGNRAIATVIEIKEYLDSEKDKKYSQVFKFTTYNNEEIIFETPDSTSKKIRATGDEVKVVYDGVNPHKKILLTHFNVFAIPLLLVALALLLLFISGAYFWSQFYFNSLH
jgi:hypothetical protein